MSKVTRLDYCQFLLVSQTNYTLTYFADHSAGFTHDAVKRTLSLPTISLRIPLRPRKRCVACAGRLSSFTAKVSKLLALKAVSAAWRVSSATILPAPFWSGFVSSKWPKKRFPLSISLSKVCSTITCVLNCVHPLSECNLRKS
jgi:hypothetical protein